MTISNECLKINFNQLLDYYELIECEEKHYTGLNILDIFIMRYRPGNDDKFVKALNYFNDNNLKLSNNKNILLNSYILDALKIYQTAIDNNFNINEYLYKNDSVLKYFFIKEDSINDCDNIFTLLSDVNRFHNNDTNNSKIYLNENHELSDDLNENNILFESYIVIRTFNNYFNIVLNVIKNRLDIDIEKINQFMIDNDIYNKYKKFYGDYYNVIHNTIEEKIMLKEINNKTEYKIVKKL